MRLPLPLLLVVSALPACNCNKSGADTPTPVTIRFTNTTSSALFIDATDTTYGMEVAPNGASTSAPPFMETLPTACACLTCDQVCSPGGCPGSPCTPPTPTNPQVQAVAAGDSVQRDWSGVYYNNQQESCGALVGGQSCLQHTNDFPDDTFTARICYALSLPGAAGVDAGVPFPGALPTGELVCAQTSFQPQQGTVQLKPPPPVPCDVDAGTSACPAGQLCFSGTCSSGCPASSFPAYGTAGYAVVVNSPDYSPATAFFTRADTATATTWSGSGTIDSAAYGTTISLNFVRSGTLKGTLSFVLPPIGGGFQPAGFTSGDPVAVTVIEAPPGSGNRAFVIRDNTGQLLQAVDMAYDAPILGSADTAPFTVTPLTGAIGCRSTGDTCKAIYGETRFTTPEGPAPTLPPAEFVTLTTSGANFQVTNAYNVSYRDNTTGNACSSTTPLFPYVISNLRP
jgi:hypothetical protein